MRIKEIQIEGLFGMFDHTITLNQEERLTIVYGINGIGKTMMFKILDYFFNAQIEKFFDAPFNKLNFTLENGDLIEFKRASSNFLVTFLNKNLKVLAEKKINVARKGFYFEDILGHIENSLKGKISHLNLMAFRKDTRNFILNNKKFIYNQDFKHKYFNKIDEFFFGINLYFIPTQRLLILPNRYSSNIRKAIQEHAQDLAFIIQGKHIQYRELSEKLELSLGKRLMNKQVKTDYTYQELLAEKEAVENKISRLRKVGLLPKQNGGEFEINEEMDDLSKAVISVSMQDFKTKLAIFDELYEKLELFLHILNNKRLFYKKLITSEEKGFEFVNDNGLKLSPEVLSSGEQHELILLYLLLFKVPENSLILIDEPEISLHVVWQKEFIKDMKDIIKLRKLDILVATHSPAIINGNWDLTVALKGIEKEEAHA